MRRFGYLISFIVAALLLQSCQQNTGELVAMPTNGMTYVKFASPEYINYVVVEDIQKDETGKRYCGIRGGGGCCEELHFGSSPYIELPNGYYLVDWKWGGMIYQPTIFLVDLRWEDVEYRNQIWEYEPNDVITNKFLKEWGSTSYKMIDQYLRTQPPTSDAYEFPALWKVESLESLSSSNKAYFFKEVEKQDSLQQIYIGRLTAIIQQGDIDKVSGYLFKY